MLDSETKRRIDSCRDILVGKVPDPKSQVEQITIALIYKFMDDMDAEAEELGGKRSFFAGEYAKYGWAKLMSPSMGGFDVLALYSEAIAKMNENPGIPALFRDIFKNAYLPYRDPETLRSFLKEINVFTYDHSERLGDAFEYLLSVLGSQGDAGQFRTPRHIIDFMVEIINPQKNESILDPACGTAGFLISAWKYILKHNTSLPSPSGRGAGGEGASVRAGDLLTPEQRKHLAANIHGYDISPDMVRLSLVNLYLHGFTDPHIVEYDTLTSEDKWNETADVILANPPFMSPKGGIKPHKRFSIQAKRSEVLFVDYMAEHLSPQGRAAIIVPEGIIFQSQTAYAQLRKMLVESSLVAVISLPAGCFNPYSGVKTSILILDKSLAKKAHTIAFFKVENDGFGLGAQRRAIDKNDLPQVQAELATYLQALRNGQPLEPSGETTSHSTTPQKARQVAGYPPGGGQGGGLQLSCGLIVAKEKIAANGDYNLSGERYREGIVSSAHFPHVTLAEVCEINPETAIPAELYPGSHFNYIDISCIENESGKFLGANKVATEEAPSRARRAVKQGDVLISTVRPNLKAFAMLTDVPERAIASTGFAVLRAKAGKLVPGFLINALRHERSVEQMVGMSGKGAYPSINQSDVESIQIPLPPLEMQKEIVAEIEGYQKVINGARAVLDHYRPHISIHPDWPAVEVSQASIVNPRKSEVADLDGATVVSFVPMSDIGENAMYFEPKDTKRLDEVTTSYTYFKDGDVLIAKVTPCFENGKAGIARGLRNGIGFGSSEYYVLRPMDAVLPEWLFMCVATPAFRACATQQMTGTGGLQRVPRAVLESFKIPLPPLATQQQIVAEIEAEQALVAANRELIARFEKKIQATLARVWGEGESADSFMEENRSTGEIPK
jgi:type I restriction enzyme M protein